MLNRHPEIAISSETQFHHYVYSRRRSFGSLSNLSNRQRLVDAYLATEPIAKMKLDPRALRETLLTEGTSYEAFFVSLLRAYARSQGKKRWGEKTPRHALITETLCQWYPGASIIHLVRDPRDVVASLRRLPGATHSVIGGASLWMQCNGGALRSQARPQYLLVPYEHLVTQPEQELRRICAALGAEYSPFMLVPDRDPATVLQWYRRAELPVTNERRGKWREELSREDVELIERITGPLMRTFGYEPVGRAPSALVLLRGAAHAAFDAVKRRARDAFKGKKQGSRISFETLELLFRLLESELVLDTWHSKKKFFCLKWFIASLAQELAISDTLKLWDSIICSGNKNEFVHFLSLSMILYPGILQLNPKHA